MTSPALRFANLTFRGLRREQVLKDDGLFKLIVTVNAEIIVEANRNEEFAACIERSWATFDGSWPYLVARWRTARSDFEKISGSDFVYDLAEMASEKRLGMFLLGATPEVNRRAVETLRSRYSIDVHGYAPPFCKESFPKQDSEEILRRIRETRPGIVVAGLGAPKQELWLDSHRRELVEAGVRWAMGAGGTLDFISGEVRRAPAWTQRLALEWAWRIFQQPSRLSRFFRALQFFQYT